VGKRRWSRWRWTKTQRGPGTSPRIRKRSTEGEGSTGDGGAPSLPGSEPPWRNSHFRRSESDWEIPRKPGRRTPRRREEAEAAAVGPR